MTEPVSNADDAIMQALLHERFDIFIRYAFSTLHPERALQWARYIPAVASAVQDVIDGQSRKLLITMPPRTLKSFIISVCLPAFVLGRDPTQQVVVATYGHELGIEHADLFLRLVRSPWFGCVFPDFELAGRGGASLENIVTNAGGGRRRVTTTGALTGMGADFIIIDDILKAQEAHSAAAREEARRFHQLGLSTRANDPSSVRYIAAMQRLHLSDFAGFLIEAGNYRHLNLPAIASRDMQIPLYSNEVWSWRAGELLSPDHLTQDVLDEQRREMGAAAYSAQYLQAPVPNDGGALDFERIAKVERAFESSSLIYTVISIDPAAKVGENCSYSVITVWGYDGHRWCLMQLVRARLEFGELLGQVQSTMTTWNADQVLIEDCQIGAALRSSLNQEVRTPSGGTIRGRVVLHPVRGSKIERAGIATRHLYGGAIVIPRDLPTYDVYRAEFIAFPDGDHDDMVDATTQFASWLDRQGADIEQLVEIKQHGRPLRTRRPSRNRR